MIVSYVRVSHVSQNTESQLQEIQKLYPEIEEDNIYIEKASGRSKDTRTALNNMLRFVRKGDEIVVYDYSRISRSLTDLLSIIEQLKKKQVKLTVIKDDFDINSVSGELMVSILGAVNQFQINIQREKQLIGIEIAKLKGKYKNNGRKKRQLSNTDYEMFKKWSNQEFTQSECMNLLGVSRATLSRRFAMIKEECISKVDL